MATSFFGFLIILSVILLSSNIAANNQHDNHANVITGLNFDKYMFSNNYLLFWIVTVEKIIGFVFGICLNGVLISIVIINNTMRSTFNILLANIGIGHILLNLVMYEALSGVMGFRFISQATTSLVTVTNLLILVVDRFIVVVRPGSTKHIDYSSDQAVTSCSSRAKTFGLVSTSWILSFVFVFVIELARPYNWVISPDFVDFLLCGVISFIIVLVLFICIGCKKSDATLQVKAAEEDRDIVNQIDERKQSTKLVLALVIGYFLFTIPVYVIRLFFDEPSMILISNLLYYGYVFINPILIYILNNDFRMYFNRYLFCCCARKHQPDPNETTALTQSQQEKKAANMIELNP